jgi:uncharacterized protein YaeQ
MALPSTLCRFYIQLSDVTRDVYQPIDLRVAMHPSESPPYLLTRVLAYCLNVQEGIELTQGIATPEEPAIRIQDLTGTILVWIDVGNPSAERLHKASKAAKTVRIYTYRDPEILLKEMEGREIHRRETVSVFSLAPRFLDSLGETLERENEWEILHDDGELTITVGGRVIEGEVRQVALR